MSVSHRRATGVCCYVVSRVRLRMQCTMKPFSLKKSHRIFHVPACPSTTRVVLLLLLLLLNSELLQLLPLLLLLRVVAERRRGQQRDWHRLVQQLEIAGQIAGRLGREGARSAAAAARTL